MRLPRDLSGRQLAKLLESRGYMVTRQKGSHMRLTTTVNGEHSVTIPDHNSLRVGMLTAILTDIAFHFEIAREELAVQLFGAG